jgi:hypothetical protein
MIRPVYRPNMQRRAAAISMRGGFIAGGFPRARGGLPNSVPVLGTAWNYSTPATATIPTSGQAIHGDNAQANLAVHKLNAAAADQSAKLSALRVGDVLTIGTATYLVTATMAQSGDVFNIPVAATGPFPIDGSQIISVARP